MPNEILNQNQTEFFKNCGKIIAPLMFNFAYYVSETANNPILISYRGAHPIKHALDHLNIESKPLWLNRNVARQLKKDIIKDYCEQQKLNEPFTFVDTGYLGTMPNLLKTDLPFKSDFQTIFLTHGYEFSNDITPFLCRNEKSNGKHITPFSFAALLDSLPGEYKAYGTQIFQYDDSGTVQVCPCKKSRFECNITKTFYAGMTEGYSMCDNNERKFRQYLNLLNDIKAKIYPGMDNMKLELKEHEVEKIAEYSKQIERIFQ